MLLSVINWKGFKVSWNFSIELILYWWFFFLFLTPVGTIKCDYFINSAGFWARSLGKKTQPVVKVPVQAVEHHYLHTKKVPGIDEDMPVIRDLDGRIYIRVRDGCYLAGGDLNLNLSIY